MKTNSVSEERKIRITEIQAILENQLFADSKEEQELLQELKELENDAKINTGWMRATTDPNEAMMGLVACIQSGKNAWIEVRANGDQQFPIMKKNPLLDDPFNWKSSYGMPRNNEFIENHKFFNDTQRDLTMNWTSETGTKEAIDLYQNEGWISQGLLLATGECSVHPVRIHDANIYRRDFTGDNYTYGFWMSMWEPKEGIAYYVIDDDVKEVFTVCYNEDTPNLKESMIHAGEFLINYAQCLKKS